ncbi:MAG: hypothetical protein ACI9L6_000405 [Flavobacterium sp.]|jgi:hypothetical protein
MKASFLKKITFFAFLLASATISFGQNAILSKNAKVSVLTCGAGNESYSLFGHTAIRITDSEHFIDLVYNYGAFDFNTPNFVAKFIKGNLQYFAVAHSFSDFINEYNYDKRSVYEQELNIPINLKQKLFDNLNSSLAFGESHYTYKFIDKNCTSMVVEIINKSLDTVAVVKNTDTSITYRTILYPYFNHHFYEKLGTSIFFGKKVDQMGTKIFLPLELHRSLKKVKFNNELLAKENKTLLVFNETHPSSWWNNCYSYLLLLGAIVIVNRKLINQLYLLMMGLLGLFFLAIGFYSSHQELGYNYNILLFNPAMLLLLYFYYVKNKKWTYALSLFNLVVLLIYLLILINKAHLFIVLPLILANGIILVRLVIENKKRIGVGI